MAHQTVDDDSLLAILFDVFRRRGYEGTTLSILSDETSLKKSSLYHRFPAGKVDMAKAVVRAVQARIQEHIIHPLQNSRKKPEARLADMISTAREFYGDGSKNCLLNVLSLEGGSSEVQVLLREAYDHWVVALASLAGEVGLTESESILRAEHFLVVLEGALVIQRLTKNEQIFSKSLAYEQARFFAKPVLEAG